MAWLSSTTTPDRVGWATSQSCTQFTIAAKSEEKAMRGIPVSHARWIESLLAQLSDEQLRDAFRAANYSERLRESYVSAFRERINQLTQLPAGTTTTTNRRRRNRHEDRQPKFKSEGCSGVRGIQGCQGALNHPKGKLKIPKN